MTLGDGLVPVVLIPGYDQENPAYAVEAGRFMQEVWHAAEPARQPGGSKYRTLS
jgi:hypothetical protein